MRLHERAPRLRALAAAIAALHAPLALGQEAAPAAVPEARSPWLTLFRDVRFTLGPVRWNGDLTMEFRDQRFSGQEAQRAFVTSANWSGASYVHQPWFAQVSGNLGFVATSAASGGESGSFSLVGGAGLVVFPQSHFPFEASLTVNDSRASESTAGVDFRSFAVSARQSYRISREAQFSARLDHSVLDGPALGRDVLNVAQATFSGRRGDHALAADGFLSANSGGASRVENRIRRATAQHNYLPSDTFNVDTLASYNWQEVRAKASGFEGGVAGQFAQLASFATWRPDEDHALYDPKRPLLVTGGLRLAASGIQAGSNDSDTLGASAFGGFTYGFARHTMAGASASVTGTRADGGGSDLLTSLNANISYDPPVLRRDRYGWGWRVSSALSSATGGESDRHAVSALASHQATADFEPLAGARLGFTFGQGLGAAANTRDESSVSLSHHAQITWIMPGAAASQTYASISVSDARSWGTPETGFFLANLQLSRQTPINALSHWSANLTVQGSRHRGEPSSATTTRYDSGLNTTVYGSAAYHHRRAFGVPRLAFLATYTANQSQQQSRAEGNLQAQPRQETNIFDARFEYRIGKLDARLVLRSSSMDGRRSSGVFLRATRHF